jgi:hypothetical protein
VPDCGFRKPDGTTCRRKVTCCWQHKRGYRGIWQALVSNPSILFLLTLGSLLQGSPNVVKIFLTPRAVTKLVAPLATENLAIFDAVAVSVHLAGTAPAPERGRGPQ